MSELTLRPCLDSEKEAALRRRELDVSRPDAAALGRSAVEAIRAGLYRTRAGLEVAWGGAVQAARAAARPPRAEGGGTAAPPSVSDFGSPHAHSIFVASFVLSFVAFDPDHDADFDGAGPKW